MNISISVIIPTYNRAHTISRAIDSVFSQSIPVDEIIVVDDGSEDSISDVMRKYTSIKKPVVKFIELEHKGAMNARNYGIKTATSNYICFLDSDDYWLNNRIEAVYSLIEDNPNSVITNTCILKDGIHESKWDIQGKSGNVYTDLLCRPWPLFPGIIANKECFESIGYLDESIVSYQEWDTSIRLANKYQFIYIDIPLFVYMVNSSENTISKSKNAKKGYWQIINKHKSSIIKNCGIKVMLKHYWTYIRL